MTKPKAGLSSVLMILPLLAIAGFAALYSRSRNSLRRLNHEGFEYYKALSLNRNEDLSSIVEEDAQGWKEDLAGFWLGTLDFGGGELRLLYRFTETYGKMHCYSLDQGGGLIPASAAQYSADTGELLLVFDFVQGFYKGTLNGGVLKGKWSQMGKSIDLELNRDTSSSGVPREFRFLVDKAVTGSKPQLQKMVGYWTGLLEDTDDDGEEDVELVVVHVAKITQDLVEPMVFLPDEDVKLPLGVRNFIVMANTPVDKPNVKIVLDDMLSGTDAIFEGAWDGNSTISGVVSYDDTDVKPPLLLKWSEEYPDLRQWPSLKATGERMG